MTFGPVHAVEMFIKNVYIYWNAMIIKIFYDAYEEYLGT